MKHKRFLRKFFTSQSTPPANILPVGALPWLLAVAAVAGAPHAMHLPYALSIGGAFLLLVRLWLWRRQLPLPGKIIRTLITLSGVIAIVHQFGSFLGRDSGVALLFFFIMLKPLEIHTRRDAMVLILLALFLLLTHYFYSESLLTGAWLIFSLNLIVMTMMRLTGGEMQTCELWRHSALMLAQAAPIMIFLFMLFPRINGPLWGLPQDAHSGKSGLSEHMSPGSFSELILSDEIAFRVHFDQQRIPPKQQLYWRGPVLTDYDGKQWRRHALLHEQNPTPPRIEADGSGQNYPYTITLEAHNMHWLLALDLPFERPPDTQLSSAFETRSKQALRQRTQMRFTANTGFIVNREEQSAVLQHALQLPAQLNPRARALAQQWRRTLQTPQNISNAALQYFRQQSFYYTLRAPLAGQHAIDDFLFHNRRGFCEHYAAAYVVLMRAAGIPARVVTGYQGGEKNPVDGQFTVRQSSAHAWAEIWLKDKGWRRIDPTAAVAPSRIEQGLSAALPQSEPLPTMMRINAPWLQHLRYRWEAINSKWHQWVISYDQQRQYDLLSLLTGLQNPDWRQLLGLLVGATFTTLLIIVLRVLRAASQPTDTTQRLWRKFCQQLIRHGIEYRPWEGPLTLAQRIQQQRPELARSAQIAVNAWICLRYQAPIAVNDQKAQQQQLRIAIRLLTQYRRKRAL